MLFNSIAAPRSGVDMAQFILDIPDALDAFAWRCAWQLAIKSHEMLHSAIQWSVGGVPVLVAEEAGATAEALAWTDYDYRDLPPSKRELAFEAFLAADRERGVNFSQPPMMRVSTFRTGDSHCRVVWSLHHVLLDGHAVFTVLREVFQCYRRLVGGQPLTLRPSVPFASYIAWAQTQDRAPARAFWTRELSGCQRPLQLPAVAPAMRGFPHERYRELHDVLPREATLALRTIAERLRVTPNTVMVAVWARVLGRWCDTDDVLFTAARSSRHVPLPGVHDIVGPLLNLVPVRIRLSARTEFAAVLLELRRQQVEARPHEHTSLKTIQGWTEIPPSMPLSETTLLFENQTLGARLRTLKESWPGLKLQLRQQPSLPIVFSAFFEDMYLHLRLSFYEHQFTQAMIRRLLDEVLATTLRVVADPRLPVGRI
jgi:hypothetical protein